MGPNENEKGLPETCDGLDNDCDGMVDDCFEVGSKPLPLPPHNPDNDCNGTVDDRFNVGENCSGVEESCVPGIQSCFAGAWTACTRKTMCSTMPGGKDDQSSKEVCNGLDDDCDGDGFPCACDNRPETEK